MTSSTRREAPFRTFPGFGMLGGYAGVFVLAHVVMRHYGTRIMAAGVSGHYGVRLRGGLLEVGVEGLAGGGDVGGGEAVGGDGLEEAVFEAGGELHGLEGLAGLDELGVNGHDGVAGRYGLDFAFLAALDQDDAGKGRGLGPVPVFLSVPGRGPDHDAAVLAQLQHRPVAADDAKRARLEALEAPDLRALPYPTRPRQQPRPIPIPHRRRMDHTAIKGQQGVGNGGREIGIFHVRTVLITVFQQFSPQCFPYMNFTNWLFQSYIVVEISVFF